MARGACVVPREGKRGVVWSIKFRDVDGRLCWERLGPEPRWNRAKAERELGKRLADVERTRWRKPDKVTFEAFTKRFQEDYIPTRNLKRSTLTDYELTIRVHLVPAFGEYALSELAVRPELVERYIGAKLAAKPPLAPKTVRNHLVLLSAMFRVAKRWKLAADNPVEVVDLPRLDQVEMSVLSEVEVARLIAAYRELELDPPEKTDAAVWPVARRLVVVALGTGLRRGELLALRWRDVSLVDGLLVVDEAFVRGEFTTPKSKASRRTIGVGRTVLDVIEEQFAVSVYRGDDDLVFGHPHIGTPLDPSKLARSYLRPALVRAKIDKRFRAFHDLRHTALTHDAASGNPQAYVQMRAGHSQGSTTERYIHAAQVLFPGAVDRADARLFGSNVLPVLLPSEANSG